MNGAREVADDIVAWVCELFSRLLSEYEQQLLEQHGLPPPEAGTDAAGRLLAEAEDQLRDTWGGQNTYVQRAPWFDKAGRDAAIKADRAAPRAMSLGQLALKYGMSKSQVKRICEDT